MFSHLLAGEHAEPDDPFFEWARWHRLSPYLQRQFPDRWPQCKRAWLESEADDLARSSWLSEFHLACQREGVRLVFFKGVGTARLAYASPSLRPLGDVDVLIAPPQLERAVGVALKMGFKELYPDPAIRRYLREKHYQVPLIHPRFGLLELHFDLYREIRPGWLEGALRRAIPMDLYGSESWVLRPEDLYPVLAVHLCHTDGSPVWVWLLDLVLLDRVVDGAKVVETARQQGTTAALVVAQAISASLWNRELLAAHSLEGALTRLEAWAVSRTKADDTTFSGARIRMAQRTRADPRELLGEAVRFMWPSQGALALEFGPKVPALPRMTFAARRLERALRAAGAGVAVLERLRGAQAAATVEE